MYENIDFITNPEKIFFPNDKITKADIISYYLLMSEILLPYVKNRPIVMKRYPEGIEGKFFYQKEIPAYAPEWIERITVWHQDTEKHINYAVITDTRSLLWLVNQGAIELHCWLSQINNLEVPDIMVIDLDPEMPSTFRDTFEIALLIRDALSSFGIKAWPKTSGSSGLHLFIPVKNAGGFKETTQAAKNLFRIIYNVCPHKVTLEHQQINRKGKIYLDYLQNTRGRTMAFPYSIRPIKGGLVSAPLLWEEIEEKSISQEDFTIFNIWKRIEKLGDIMNDFLINKYDISPLLKLNLNLDKGND